MDYNSENISIRIGRIIAHSITGSIAPAEQEELNRWLQNETHQRIYKEILKGQSISGALSELDGFDVAEGYQTLQASVQKSRSIRYRTWVAVAAAVLVFLTASATIYMITRNKQPAGSSFADINDIRPGGNKAQLTLADGRTITLDEARDGIVVGSGGITYNDGNPLADVALNEEEEEIPLLELRTPKGGTYQITLPDGTKVWLNSASTLTYPGRFNQHERRVVLDGEAYFEVSERLLADTQQKQPFSVVSEGQVVEVLGTQFNVSAYPDDSEMKTTLVEGRVKVVLPSAVPDNTSGKEVVLEPGQQATLRGTLINIQAVDVEQFTAWKEGLFYFDGMAPNIAFDQLERWYDISVGYEGNISTVQFFGMIDRNKSLGAVLKSLESSGLRFKMGGETDDGKKRLIIIGD